MKKILLLIGIFCIVFKGNAQKLKTSRDSTKIFYDKIFKAFEVAYLYKKDYDWKKLKTETFQNLESAKDFKGSLSEVKVLFEKVNANHSVVSYQEKTYGMKTNIPWDNFSEQWMKKFNAKPKFEAQVLDGKYGYILMPNISSDDFSNEYINKTAQLMYDKIAELKTNNNLEGWIVDLRFNSGGNSAPMLLALYDLLGDNVVWGMLDEDKKRADWTRLNKGAYDQGNKNPSNIKPKGELLDEAKVAVLIGGLTASSGEITALAFKGRVNTVFIGEKTMGKTTSNFIVTLPFGGFMSLSNGYDCDRNKNYYAQIPPDVEISKQDNFEDYMSDQNIKEAIKFFKNKIHNKNDI
ncbi:Peptidase family S41 [Chryseobacterium formosense]|uniref:S41 family peptidase n=1 Tax=Chryseobacterium formosense TaxID=236814 RepID=UPI00068A90E1|nr:S41 family peptidase [Chryseobacterium formosense]SFT54946.1 Peptidase family S41 [Chryseobacterium formosense]